MMRASPSIFALQASLFLSLFAVAGCREVKGQCSKREDTLCLQIDLADRSVVPEVVTLALVANEVNKTTELPNAAATLRERPYVIEFELSNPPPITIDVTATGTNSSTSTTRLNLRAQQLVRPAGAARPTILILTGPGGTDLDMAASDDGPSSIGDGSVPPDQRPAQWRQVYSATNRLRALSGTMMGGLTLWGVGDNGLVVRGDGNSFNALTPPALNAPLTGLWAVSSSTAWVCDAMGRVFFTTDSGGSWTPSVTLGYALRGIYGRATNDIMVVGDHTTMGHHFDGSMWNVVQHSIGDPATSVFYGSMYWYVVGYNGKGARAQNPEMPSSWATLVPLSASSMRMISGQMNSDQFPLAVGDNGTVQYYHPAGMWMGTGYIGGTANLTSTWVTSTGFAHVAGANGTVWRYTNGPWVSLSNANLTGYDLTGIWGDGAGGLWVAGFGLASDPGGIWKY